MRITFVLYVICLLIRRLRRHLLRQEKADLLSLQTTIYINVHNLCRGRRPRRPAKNRTKQCGRQIASPTQIVFVGEIFAAPSDEGAVAKRLRERKALKLLLFWSLPPSFAYGKIHLPHQMEAKFCTNFRQEDNILPYIDRAHLYKLCFIGMVKLPEPQNTHLPESLPCLKGGGPSLLGGGI